MWHQRYALPRDTMVLESRRLNGFCYINQILILSRISWIKFIHLNKLQYFNSTFANRIQKKKNNLVLYTPQKQIKISMIHQNVTRSPPRGGPTSKKFNNRSRSSKKKKRSVEKRICSIAIFPQLTYRRISKDATLHNGFRRVSLTHDAYTHIVGVLHTCCVPMHFRRGQQLTLLVWLSSSRGASVARDSL